MELEQLAANYQPNQSIIEVVRQSKMVFLVGIISAGKDALQKKLLELGGYFPIVTHTTRQPRLNCGVVELDGLDYHFVTEDKMFELLNNQKIIEVNHFGNSYYATCVDEFIAANERNLIAVANLDINGISSMRSIAPDKVSAFFIIPPNYDIWLNRLKYRYGSLDSFNNEWQVRREITINEIKTALDSPDYYFVINDNLDSAAELINSVAKNGVDNNQDDNYARGCAKELLDAIQQVH